MRMCVFSDELENWICRLLSRTVVRTCVAWKGFFSTQRDSVKRVLWRCSKAKLTHATMVADPSARQSEGEVADHSAPQGKDKHPLAGSNSAKGARTARHDLWRQSLQVGGFGSKDAAVVRGRAWYVLSCVPRRLS